jgi:hypothetical protein
MAVDARYDGAGTLTGYAEDAPAGPVWTPEIALQTVLPERTQTDARLAFALHASELLNHYGPIWERLDPDSFEIVYASEYAGDNARIAAFAAAHGYRASFVRDVLAEGRVFAAIVSNHTGSAGMIGPNIALPRLGVRHVRLMYGLGKDGWHFAPWNEFYDVILCWGPYQAERLAQFNRPRVIQVGYPRFDRFFSLREPRSSVVARFGGDPQRRTLVWLPTWGRHSSIDAFAETIAGLQGELNVLVKVHPLTAEAEPHRMAHLAEAGLRPLAIADLDNVELFYAADVVAADYGGSPFGAIYADRDIVLLDSPGVEGSTGDIVPEDSLDRRLREWILNIDPDEAGLLLDYLDDAAAQEQQRGVRERLRRSLFAPFHGCAAEVAATVLRNLEAVCR